MDWTKIIEIQFLNKNNQINLWTVPKTIETRENDIGDALHALDEVRAIV